jgi:hypothetical protein
MKLTKTTRDFERIQFEDHYGESCSIQYSSLATANAIWFGLDSVTPKVMASSLRPDLTGWVTLPLPEGTMLSARMHLTRDQVAELLPILQYFAETGNLPEIKDKE